MIKDLRELQSKRGREEVTDCSCDMCIVATWNPPHPRAKRPVSKYAPLSRDSSSTPLKRKESREAEEASSSLGQPLPPVLLGESGNPETPGFVCAKCFTSIEEGNMSHKCSRDKMLENISVNVSP